MRERPCQLTTTFQNKIGLPRPSPCSLVAEPVRLACNGTSSGGTPYSSKSCEYNDFVGWQEAAVDQLAAQGVKVDDYLYT